VWHSILPYGTAVINCVAQHTAIWNCSN